MEPFSLLLSSYLKDVSFLIKPQFRTGAAIVLPESTIHDIPKKDVNYIQIPNKVPNEILENASLLVLEKGLNNLEDRLVITARNVLGMNYELKTQINEISRLEKAIVNMHEYMVLQQDKIENLESQVENLRTVYENTNPTKEIPGPGFWTRFFSK